MKSQVSSPHRDPLDLSRPFWAPFFQCLNLFFTGSINQIDSSITEYQHVLSMLSRSDPHRHLVIFCMASEQCRRHLRSNQREDLDNSIHHFTKSILLQPLSWLQHGPIILDALFLLAFSLFLRSQVYKQAQDSVYATKYLFHLRDQPYEIPNTRRHQVTTLLVDALALQVELDVGDVMQNIQEMAILSRELLTLDMSDADTTRLILPIHDVVMSKILPGSGVPDQPLDELIEFLRAARKHRPDLLEGRTAFALSLASRYCMTRVNDDYEEAVLILDEISTSCPENSHVKSISAARGFATGLATALAILRSVTIQTPENLEEAIYRTRTCSSSSSYKDLYPSLAFEPEVTAKDRFRHFGSIEGIQASSSSGSPLSALSQAVPEIQEFIHSEEKIMEFIQSEDKIDSLIFWIRNTDDRTKIDETLEKFRSVLASDSLTDLIKSPILDLFGGILFEVFNRTKKIEYLNESINIRRQSIESPFPQVVRLLAYPPLSHSLLARFHFFRSYRTQDLDEALELFSQYVTHARASLPDRFLYASEWAHFARLYRHSSVSKAYETAMSLTQDTLHFSPTLQLQHTTLAKHYVTQGLPLDFASHRIDLHQLEEAIEVLERGRALLWSEMRHLRSSADQLLEADPELGRKFAAVNRDLEELTKSVPPSHQLGKPTDDGASDDLRAADLFGRLVLKRSGLLMERAKLISQIQALPGFDSFLESPSFDTLRSAASSGPVIIINHSIFRSDILVLLHNMPPSLIPTPPDFFERAAAIKDNLLDSRHKSGLDSKDYDKTLALVLAELYILVGQPVIDRLRQLQVPEQSRIWWCPTSVFYFLPLHAMGPIPSDDNDEPLYFLDLYICSYTPTLSALIQSRHNASSSRSSDRPSVLLVAQPDPSLPTVGGEIQAVQALDTEVTSLISKAATPATVIDGFIIINLFTLHVTVRWKLASHLMPDSSCTATSA
jgi:tetratricopeptide (TPR) repeat protein